MATVKIELDLEDAFGLATAITVFAEVAKSKLLQDPERVNLLFRLANEIPQQILDQTSAEDIALFLRKKREHE